MKPKYLKEVEATIPSDLASVHQASTITGIGKRTIWKKIREGQLNAWGPRRCYRVSISELLKPVRARVIVMSSLQKRGPEGGAA